MSDSDVLLERDTASQEEPQPGLQHVLRAAILGVPNAGKTTLVNQLLGQKVYTQFVFDELCTFGDSIHNVQAPQLFGIVVGVVFMLWVWSFCSCLQSLPRGTLQRGKQWACSLGETAKL